MRATEFPNFNRNTKQRVCKYSYKPLKALLMLFLLDFRGQSAHNLCSILRSTVIVSAITFIQVYSFYFKITRMTAKVIASIRITDTVQMIFDYCQYLIDLFFVHKYGQDVSIEYSKQYDRIDGIMGMSYYPNLKQRMKKVILLFMFVWVTITTCDFVAWALAFGWFISLIYAVNFIFLLIKMTTILDLTYQVSNIEIRLQMIADAVQQYCVSTACVSDLIGDPTSNKKWLYNEGYLGKKLNRPEPLTVFTRSLDDPKWLNRCYLLLLEQCAFINHVYGVRILLNSLSLLIDMVRFINLGVRVLIGTQHVMYENTCFPIISSIMKAAACAFILVVLVYYCERAYRQGDRVISLIDHLLVTKCPKDALRSSMQELRNLVQSRPIDFHLAFFFRLNYALLISIASVVSTYTIILLQSPD